MIIAMPIEVGVVCKKKERPVPMKFKYAPTPDDPVMVINVDKVLSVEEIRDVGSKAYLYKCQSYINGILKVYDLKFIIDRYEWQLFRM